MGKKVCAIENVKTTRVGGISSIVKGKGDQLWQQMVLARGGQGKGEGTEGYRQEGYRQEECRQGKACARSFSVYLKCILNVYCSSPSSLRQLGHTRLNMRVCVCMCVQHFKPCFNERLL